MDQPKIDRINELARKKKASGLTSEEEEEQRLLRAEYLEAIRASVKSALENTVVEYPDGEKIPLSDCKKQLTKSKNDSIILSSK